MTVPVECERDIGPDDRTGPHRNGEVVRLATRFWCLLGAIVGAERFRLMGHWIGGAKSRGVGGLAWYGGRFGFAKRILLGKNRSVRLRLSGADRRGHVASFSP